MKNVEMKTAAKIFAVLFCAATAVVLLVVIAGMIRFNLTNDDIYVRGETGEIVLYENASRE